MPAGDKRTMLPTEGIPFLKLKHANLRKTDRGRGTQLTLGAFRNGQGSVCMLMSTQYCLNHWDIIPRNSIDSDLHLNERHLLRKKGFNLAYSKHVEKDIKDLTHDLYYELFQALQIKMVTVRQGGKEWHICRPFALTSSTVKDILAVLNRHNVDWPEFISVRKFYSRTHFNRRKEQANPQSVVISPEPEPE